MVSKQDHDQLYPKASIRLLHFAVVLLSAAWLTERQEL